MGRRLTWTSRPGVAKARCPEKLAPSLLKVALGPLGALRWGHVQKAAIPRPDRRRWLPRREETAGCITEGRPRSLNGLGKVLFSLRVPLAPRPSDVWR